MRRACSRSAGLGVGFDQPLAAGEVAAFDGLGEGHLVLHLEDLDHAELQARHEGEDIAGGGIGDGFGGAADNVVGVGCLLYTSPSPRDS